VLNVVLDASCDLPTIFFTQKTLGAMIGKSYKTAARAINELVAAGLIKKVNRYYQTCIYSINKILLTPLWHKELYHWFRRYPAMIVPLAISLLFSPVQAKQERCPTIISGPPVYLVSKRHTAEGYPSCKRGMPVSPQTEIKKESNNMKQVDPLKAKRVRGIALALNNRGAKLSNYEAIGLMAYDDAILDAASSKMRESKGIRNPAAFFFGFCKQRTQETDCLPDWDMVRYMRDNSVRLLTPEEELTAAQVAVSDNAPRRTPKREQCEQLYSEQIKQGQARERQAAEQRKPSHLKAERTVLLVESELAGWRAALAEQETKHRNIPLWPYLRGVADKSISRLEQELADLYQISNTIHEGVSGNGATAGTPIIACPGSNL
jgi:hypothetical protein